MSTFWNTSSTFSCHGILHLDEAAFKLWTWKDVTNHPFSLAFSFYKMKGGGENHSRVQDKDMRIPVFLMMAARGTGGEGWVHSRPNTSLRLQPGAGRDRRSQLRHQPGRIPADTPERTCLTYLVHRQPLRQPPCPEGYQTP